MGPVNRGRCLGIGVLQQANNCWYFEPTESKQGRGWGGKANQTKGSHWAEARTWDGGSHSLCWWQPAGTPSPTSSVLAGSQLRMNKQNRSEKTLKAFRCFTNICGDVFWSSGSLSAKFRDIPWGYLLLNVTNSGWKPQVPWRLQDQLSPCSSHPGVTTHPLLWPRWRRGDYVLT